MDAGQYESMYYIADLDAHLDLFKDEEIVKGCKQAIKTYLNDRRQGLVNGSS